jgi:hypothetical protein
LAETTIRLGRDSCLSSRDWLDNNPHLAHQMVNPANRDRIAACVDDRCGFHVIDSFYGAGITAAASFEKTLSTPELFTAVTT